MAYDLGVTARQRYTRPVYSGIGGTASITHLSGSTFYDHRYTTAGVFTNTSTTPIPIELIDDRGVILEKIVVPSLGTVSISNGPTISYTVHSFTSSGVFTSTNNITSVRCLLVAGGGGGGTAQTGDHEGSGGGAGGVRLYETLGISAGSQVVTVGAGGPAISPGTLSAITGLIGSVIFPTGGGQGKGTASSNGGPGNGGSGGGSYLSNNAGLGISGEGFDGGSPGAGGGAGAAGGLTVGNVGGTGGIGRQISITGVSTYYGGGGGSTGVTQGQGGLGGGGRGGKSSGTTSAADLCTPGQPNTGGGGGGGSLPNSAVGGSGGSGIVIIKYPTSLASATGGSITYVNEQSPVIVRYTARSSTDPDTNFKNTSLLLSAGLNPIFVEDYSISNFNINVVGDTRPDNFNPYSDNYSIQFNGSTSYLTVASTSTAAFGLNDFTVEAWIYVTGAPGTYRTIYSTRPSSSTAGIYTGGAFGVNPTGGLYWYTGEFVVNNVSDLLLTNCWNHVAVVKHEGYVNVFLNGLVVPNTDSEGVTGLVVDYLVVAGGGGGGSTGGDGFSGQGGGGAGGLLTSYIDAGYGIVYPVIVGAGAAVGAINGSTSSFSTVVATGGGRGGAFKQAGYAGGSGGGAGGRLAYLGGAGITGQGNKGGSSNTGDSAGTGSGGGGGGATAAGTNGVTGTGGRGGDGLASSISGISKYYAGGGGGMAVGTGGAGGLGGGGAGASASGSTDLGPGGNATPNTGGGGGGGPGTGPGLGGSGIVILRHPNTQPQATVTGGATITTTGSNIVYTFTASGTISFVSTATPPPPDQLIFTTATIGANLDGSELFSGYISNLRVVKGEGLYKEEFTVSTQPLTTATIGHRSINSAITGTVALLAAASNKFVDKSPANLSFTTGTASVSNLQPFTYPYSVNGSAYFDGNGDNLLINYRNDLNLSADFTIECWFYANAYGGMILNFAGGLNIAWASYELVNNSDGINFAASSANTAYDIGSETGATGRIGTIQLGTWNHLAVTRSGNIYRGFVNGVQGYTQTLALTPYDPNARGLTIGSNYSTTWGSGTPTSVVNGYISDVRIVKGSSNYSENFTLPTAPLTVITNTVLLTLQTNGVVNNESFYDKSFVNSKITPVGTIAQGSTGPYGQEWSGYFDGTGDYIGLAGSGSQLRNSGSFTIEGWYYPTSSAVSFRAIYSSISDYIVAGRLYQYGTELRFYWNASSFVTGSIGWTLNAWNHFAVTWNGTTTKVYVNGQVTISTNSPIYSSLADLNIGDPTYSPLGYISNFRIVSSVVYNASFIPPSSNLSIIPNTQLLTLQGGSFSDAVHPPGSGATNVVLSSNKSIYLSQRLSDSYLTVSNANLALGATEFTIEFWVYPTADFSQDGYSTDAPIKSTPDGGAQQWAFDLGRAGYFSMLSWWSRALDNSQNYDAYGALIGVERPTNWLNNWHHIALTRKITSNSVYTYYLDGIASGTYSHPSIGSFSDNTSLTIDRSVVGYLRDIRITKSLVYTGNFAFNLPTGPLAVLNDTVLLVNVGNVSNIEGPKDYSTNNITVTVVNGTTPFTYPNFFPFVSPALGLGNFDVIPYGNASIRKFSPHRALGYNSLINSGSMYFNGSSDYLNIDYTPIHIIGTRDFTIDAWVYPLNFTGIKTILSSAPSLATGAYYFGIVNASGFLTFDFSNSAIYTGTTAVKLGSWNYVSVTRRSGTLYFWINGQLDGSAVFTNSIDVAGGLRVGAGRAVSNYFTGYMSDVRLIIGTALYAGSNYKPLTAINNTVLLTAQSSSLIDNSTYENTIGGSAFISTSTPFAINLGTNGYFSYSFINTAPTKQVLSIANTSTLNFGSSDFTIEAWIYPTDVAGEHVIASLYGYSNNRRSWYLSVRSGQILFRVGTGSGASILYSTTEILTNTWYFISAIKQGTTAKIYINGSLDATDIGVASSIYNNTVDPIYIGAVGPSLTGYYEGLISNLRILKGTASIPTVAKTSFFLPQSPALAIPDTVLLINGTDGAIVDRTGRNHVITVNDAKLKKSIIYENQSVTFDGSGDYLNIPYNAAHNLSNGNFTIEAWIYPTTTGVQRGIINNWQTGGQFQYYLTAANRLEFSYTNIASGVSTITYTGTTSITANQWTHVAVVRNGTSLTHYINGVIDAGGSFNIGTQTLYYYNGAGKDFRIGVSGDLGNFFTGIISDLRIVKGTAVYTANFTSPTTRLTAITDTLLLTCQGNLIKDYSNNNFAITVNGNTVLTPTTQFGLSPSSLVTPYANGTILNSMYFDGTGDYISIPLTPSLQFGTGDFTIEFWSFFIARGSSGSGLVNNYTSFTAGSLGIFAGHGTADVTKYQVSYNGTGFPNIQSTTSILYNQWAHIAVVRYGTTITLYINGIANGTITGASAALNGVGSWSVGTAGDGVASYTTNGYIQDLRITNGIARYTANFSVPYAPYPTR